MLHAPTCVISHHCLTSCLHRPNHAAQLHISASPAVCEAKRGRDLLDECKSTSHNYIVLTLLVIPIVSKQCNDTGENLEQGGQRKMCSEMDTMATIMQWQATISRLFPQKLCPNKGLDVWKYGLALRGGSTSETYALDTWRKIGVRKGASLQARVHALARLTTAELKKLQLQSAHPAISCFSGLALRVRFIKGFAPVAWEMLRVKVWERMTSAAT